MTWSNLAQYSKRILLGRPNPRRTLRRLFEFAQYKFGGSIKRRLPLALQRIAPDKSLLRHNSLLRQILLLVRIQLRVRRD